jgi:hypothetical protein
MNTSNPDFLARDGRAAHGGVERVIERAGTIKQWLARAASAQYVPAYVLGLTIMAVVTLAERALDGTGSGFAFEWIALSAVALLTFVLAADAIGSLTRRAQVGIRAIVLMLSSAIDRVRKARADEKLWAVAAHDPRVMNDILWARGRSEELVDEPRVQFVAPAAPAINTTRAPRGDAIPSFSRYY